MIIAAKHVLCVYVIDHFDLYSSLICRDTSHQCSRVIPYKRAVVGYVSMKYNEEKEQPQHHITKVTQNIVEGTG